MKGKVFAIICVIYVILSVFVTKFLLDRNDYGVFETKDNYYVCNSKIEEYSGTALVKFNKLDDYNKISNEKIYYFDEKELKSGTLTSYDKEEKVFTVDENNYSVENLLGKPSNGYFLIGSLLSFLTTKVFYLIFIIIPVLILLIYEIYLLVKYVRNNKERKGSNNEKIVEKN